MKPVLIGAYSPDPLRPLWPEPEGSQGWFLWRLLATRLGCTAQEYVDRWERHTILSATRKYNRQKAMDLWYSLRGRQLILVGRKVPKMFGRGTPEWVYPYTDPWGTEWRTIPLQTQLDPVMLDIVTLLLVERHLDQT